MLIRKCVEANRRSQKVLFPDPWIPINITASMNLFSGNPHWQNLPPPVILRQ